MSRCVRCEAAAWLTHSWKRRPPSERCSSRRNAVKCQGRHAVSAKPDTLDRHDCQEGIGRAACAASHSAERKHHAGKHIGTETWNTTEPASRERTACSPETAEPGWGTFFTVAMHAAREAFGLAGPTRSETGHFLRVVGAWRSDLPLHGSARP